MRVRKTRQEDLETVMALYQGAVAFMAENGNPNQWVGGYPSRELIEADIKKGISYVLEEKEIEAVFSFVVGADPTYQRIEQGRWLNEAEYGTIHRLASSGKRNGMAGHCIRWCAAQCSNLRADTHADNQIMQHVLEKSGFVRCGVICLLDGAPRIAYQRVESYPGAGVNFTGAD